MAISFFDGNNQDAYWWVLCTEKHFKANGTPEKVKVTVAALALQGQSLQWWLWWSHRHPASSWDIFTTDFLWRFKPECRQILPVLHEETEPNSESLTSVEAPSSVDDFNTDAVADSVIDPVYVLPISDKEEKPEPKSESESEPESHKLTSHGDPVGDEVTLIEDAINVSALDMKREEANPLLSKKSQLISHCLSPLAHQDPLHFNDNNNFELHHYCPVLPSCGNDATNLTPAPPPLLKPPDLSFEQADSTRPPPPSESIP